VHNELFILPVSSLRVTRWFNECTMNYLYYLYLVLE